jgi:RNA polymerase sigma-54 factor
MSQRLGLGQHLKQTQNLVLTQQMQQAIKILQLNHLELINEIQEELSQNPTLEEASTSQTTEYDEGQASLERGAAAQAEDVVDQNNGSTEAPGGERDWGQLLQEQGSAPGDFKNAAGPSPFDDLPSIDQTLAASESLSQHLIAQIGTVSCRSEVRQACVAIVLNLDGRGWLEMSLEEVATEAEVSLEDAQDALDIVQSLDPIGCGARSLVECLCVQAALLWPEDPSFARIITHHLSDLQARNYPSIGRAMDMHLEDVVEYHKMIQTLEPWPGRPYGEPPNPYITPDVEVVKMGGRWQIRQNEDGLPRLRVSPYYRGVLQDGGSTREEKKFIKERLEAAEFLIKSIYQRQSTIQKVMNVILERQEGFFDRGPEQLRPMILRNVAEEIGVHESTVSRATSNKYVLTPHGIFELKYFFDAAIQRTHGEDLAGEAVREKLRKLIQEEDRKNPLSDEALVQLLTKQNVKIARRTVAKYRDQMGILPSSQRKQMF